MTIKQSVVDRLYDILKRTGALSARDMYQEVFGAYTFMELFVDDPYSFIEIGAYYQAIGRKILVKKVKSNARLISSDGERIFSVSEVSELLDVADETVRRWIRKGDLKADIHSRKKGFLIRREDLKAFVDNNPKYRHKFGEE